MCGVQFCVWLYYYLFMLYSCFFFSSRRRHTSCALVTGVQTCALPISPGEVIAGDGDVELFDDATTIAVEVANTGDRPIQVGSHYHFAEANPALDRKSVV